MQNLPHDFPPAQKKEFLIPWQGTTLAIFSIVGAILTILLGTFFILTPEIVFPFLEEITFESAEKKELITHICIGSGILLILLGVIYSIVTYGLFFGKYNALIAIIVLSILQVLANVFLFNGIAVGANVFFIYIALQVLRHPFYQKR